MRLVWHRLFVALALAWVFAPVLGTAMETGPDAGSGAGAGTRTGYVSEASGAEISGSQAGSASADRHNHAMADCCRILMPETCTISGAGNCASGASALSLAGHIMAVPPAAGPSVPGQEAPLSAPGLAADPPPPRI